MSDSEKIGLFILIVGLGLFAGRLSATLAREIGIPALAISVTAGLAGHLVAADL
jgi:hypothetical protein